jgi:hypothetical protein
MTLLVRGCKHPILLGLGYASSSSWWEASHQSRFAYYSPNAGACCPPKTPNACCCGCGWVAPPKPPKTGAVVPIPPPKGVAPLVAAPKVPCGAAAAAGEAAPNTKVLLDAAGPVAACCGWAPKENVEAEDGCPPSAPAVPKVKGVGAAAPLPAPNPPPPSANPPNPPLPVAAAAPLLAPKVNTGGVAPAVP